MGRGRERARRRGRGGAELRYEANQGDAQKWSRGADETRIRGNISSLLQAHIAQNERPHKA